MSKKKYRIQTSCPQCGCSAVSTLSEEEIQRRYGDVPNIELECGECMEKYAAEMENVCAEWDQECKERKKNQ
jgi:redox-regulated HSP33 family molecular chaperone